MPPTPDAFPDLLAAGITNEGSSYPNNLYAGDADVVSDQVVLDADYPQFTILVKNTDGTAGAWNGTSFPGNASATVEKVPFAILAQPGLSGDSAPIYTGGYFNYALLKKAAAAAVTLADAKRGFVGTMISVDNIRGSNGRIALPAL